MSLTYPFLTQSTAFLKTSFFPSTIIKSNKLDVNLRNMKDLFIFKKHILQFIWPPSNSVYNTYNLKGIKLMTRLYLGLSHLSRSFQNSINSLYNCHYEVESTVHFFLHYPLFANERSTLFSTLCNIGNCLKIAISF